VAVGDAEKAMDEWAQISVSRLVCAAVLGEVTPETEHHPARSRTIVLLALVAMAPGCVFRGVRRDVRVMQRTVSIRGTVAREHDRRGDILVVAYTPGASIATDVFTLPEPGEYLFTLRAGDYRILAFEDQNEDRALDPRSELRSEAIDVRLAEGENRHDVDLRLSASVPVPTDFPRLPAPGRRQAEGLPDIDVGVITTLDDPRFSDDNGRLGMWQPVAFMFDVGAGIYFLDACDALRTPILFVHGIGGHPAEFKYLVGTLDRRRFQPWFVYYPSGFELGRIADGLLRWMQELQMRCGFHHLVVVAHSMAASWRARSSSAPRVAPSVSARLSRSRPPGAVIPPPRSASRTRRRSSRHGGT
jgi:hypothetical protein